MLNKIVKSLIFFGLVYLTSCSSAFYHPVKTSPARLGEGTEVTQELRGLPAPKEKVVVAVYNFRDQTGQYKPTENGSSWSTAVTQGATNILLKALEDSNWFVPIERENISDLLNERKIIRSTRTQFGNNEDLPALLYAGLILEGGIVSYDANIVTGGAGLRYFGAGGSSKYRQDRVTIYLRAVSVSNGKILKTVYTSKTILSQGMDGGLFRFVRFGRLLEAEMGFTYNEPSEVALTEAIEKAVQSLIIEGVVDNLWELKEKKDLQTKSIKDYLVEKNTLTNTDIFGRELKDRRNKWAMSASLPFYLYKGDYPASVMKYGGQIGLSYAKNPYWNYAFQMEMGEMGTRRYFTTPFTAAELSATYRIIPYNNFTPYLNGGFGVITSNKNSRFDFANPVLPKIHGGVGLEMMLSDRIGINAGVDMNFLFNDKLDGVTQGYLNDYYWKGNIGFNFYFGEILTGRRKFTSKK